MTSPQTEKGYFKIANELALALTRVNLSSYESRVLWAILRKTYGWQKKYDWVTNTQIEKITGISRHHISRTKKKLVHRMIVTQVGNKVGINKNYEEWLDKDCVTQLGLNDTYLGIDVAQVGIKVLPTQVSTKDNKDTIQKKLTKGNHQKDDLGTSKKKGRSFDPQKYNALKRRS